MAETRMLTFAMWRDGHCLGLEELLRSLGPLIETYEWRLTIDWLIPEIEIPQDMWLSTAQVVQLFESHLQLVDGEAEGRKAGSSIPNVCFRAFDSGSWDVQTARPDVAGRIGELYPDAVELEKW
ncbi:hypothetical protein OIE66_39640 [Nonomuraea sp. NBC_01738]|uniref:hypothetical protein n=1 Tax=Nonomuraea sp. NBC_01738 TaxID=2976003 RepID=UPI002E0EFF62|nr:hypothetical protein OIE66_39640 [Nonomuraea sp. NBC_01738]